MAVFYISDLLYNFYIPHDIYGMDKDTNFKVGAWIGHKDYYPKIAKLAQADARPSSCNLLLKFGILHFSGKGITRDFKFGAQIGCQAYKQKMQK